MSNLQYSSFTPKRMVVHSNSTTDHGDVSDNGSLAWAIYRITNGGQSGFIQLVPGDYHVLTNLGGFGNGSLTIQGCGRSTNLIYDNPTVVINESRLFEVENEIDLILKDFRVSRGLASQHWSAFATNDLTEGTRNLCLDRIYHLSSSSELEFRPLIDLGVAENIVIKNCVLIENCGIRLYLFTNSVEIYDNYLDNNSKYIGENWGDDDYNYRALIFCDTMEDTTNLKIFRNTCRYNGPLKTPKSGIRIGNNLHGSSLITQNQIHFTGPIGYTGGNQSSGIRFDPESGGGVINFNIITLEQNCDYGGICVGGDNNIVKGNIFQIPDSGNNGPEISYYRSVTDNHFLNNYHSRPMLPALKRIGPTSDYGVNENANQNIEYLEVA